MKIAPPLSPYGSPLAENRQKEKTMTCKMVIVPLVAGLLVGSADLLLGSPDKTSYTYIYIDDTNCILNPPPNGTQCGSIHQARLDNTVTYTYTGRKYRDRSEEHTSELQSHSFI